MFATKGVEQILGLSSQQLMGKSFYYMIAENCLGQAVHTLESAKGNDSIAYLRFWYRDPTQPDILPIEHPSDDESDSDSDGGVKLESRRSSRTSSYDPEPDDHRVPRVHVDTPVTTVNTNGTHPTTDHVDADGNAPNQIFDRPELADSDSSATSISHDETPSPGAIELEAVVSCTSDGLVVVLRRANPMLPTAASPTQPAFPNGLFATPWADKPILPPHMSQVTSAPNLTFPPVAEPVESGFMSAIRDVAVFAWSLMGINGALVDHRKGEPQGEALPPGGLPVWDPNVPAGQNDCYNGYSGGTHRPLTGSGTPAVKADGVQRQTDEAHSSDEEPVWKRQPIMPTFKRPRKRAHSEIVGSSNGHALSRREVEEFNHRRRRKINEDGSHMVD
ncbi:hypothetical protein LTR66_016124, partial [Elasticomyces elasticus]